LTSRKQPYQDFAVELISKHPEEVLYGQMPAMAEACALQILVADDNPDVREMTAVLPRLQGHDVQTACDGVEAVSIASGFRPELILLDLQMPHMDGFAAARSIRDVDPAYGQSS
jgi:CheY-like chemotaxis protein